MNEYGEYFEGLEISGKKNIILRATCGSAGEEFLVRYMEFLAPNTDNINGSFEHDEEPEPPIKYRLHKGEIVNSDKLPKKVITLEKPEKKKEPPVDCWNNYRDIDGLIALLNSCIIGSNGWINVMYVKHKIKLERSFYITEEAIETELNQRQFDKKYDDIITGLKELTPKNGKLDYHEMDSKINLEINPCLHSEECRPYIEALITKVHEIDLKKCLISVGNYSGVWLDFVHNRSDESVIQWAQLVSEIDNTQ